MKDNTNWARLCDTCKSASSTIYCRVDSAYLCTGCDSRIHAPNQVASRHERVWVCESCERAPSAFLCKADSASLCTTCDADIHSANPLAHRHHRVPVEPIPGSLYGPRVTDPGGSIDEFMTQQEGDEQQIIDDEEDEEEAASWLLTNPVKNGNNQSNGFLFGGDQVDEYLDLMDQYDSNSPEDNQISDQFGQEKYSVPQKSYGGDSVVPVQSVQGQIQQQFMFQLGLEFESSKAAYSYNGSISPNVSSIDVGVVPNPTMSDISVSDSIPARKETIDFFNGGTINQMPTQLSPKDREARVLRYKEKKKTRKFEKTIRYASRKAYAETRPRIKGRFAKRTGLGQVQVDQMFSSTLMTETGYGIVPSF